MTMKHGKWSPLRFASTWQKYRYASEEGRRPVYDPRKKREGLDPKQIPKLVSDVTGVLRDFHASPFEHEASCRHGVRSALCLDGKTWDFADAVAAYVVGEGLRNLGAERPSWDEGQPEAAARVEQCLWCLTPLDDDDIAYGLRFCTKSCAKSFIVAREARWEHHRGAVETAAFKATTAAAFRRRDCVTCGKSFRPRGYDQARFCSWECRSVWRRVDRANKDCPNCGKSFRPQDAAQQQKFCCNDCRYEYATKRVVLSNCEYCGNEYPAGSTLSRYCGGACSQAAKAERQGRALRDLKPHVFDHYFTVPINSRPPWLTPERFDELVTG